MKLRGSIRQSPTLTSIATALLLLAAAPLLSSCNIFKPKQPELPLPIIQYIPSTWSLLPAGKTDLDQLQEVNIDNDPESEWMLFFNYDNTATAKGPIGGVIYDGQQNTELYNPEVIIPFPYQPTAFLVPYRLLPDWTPDKGQGYLGDATVSYEQTTITPGRNTPDELVVMGYGPGNVVTRLSVFYWQGITNGYGVAHFVGSQSVSTPSRAEGAPVGEVVTLNRFNDRSNLCKQTVYQRQGNSPAWTASAPTIVFCQSGVPPQPMYPDSTALAYMLTGNTALLLEGQQHQVEPNFDWRRLKQVFSLTYTGVAPSSGVGTTAVTTEEVVAVVDMGAGPETYRWRLTEIKPKTASETAVWKIVDVQRIQ